jgi:general stress protein 26
MSKKNPIAFIQQKIQELKTALFFPETGSLFNIPNYLVNLAELDEAGNIWFVIHKPAKYIDPLDTKFSCKLDFFKKGMSHYVKVQGKATILTKLAASCPIEMYEINQFMKRNQMAAIKVEIEQAEFFETPSVQNKMTAKEKKSFLINFFPQRENLSPSFKTAYSC